MRTSDALLRQLLLPLASIAGALGLLALVIYWVRVWWRDRDGPAASSCDLLSEYRELNQRGELSDEEYRIIKSRFASALTGGTGAARERAGPRPEPPAPTPPTEEAGEIEKL